MHGSRRILIPLAALVAVSAAGACSNSSSSGAREAWASAAVNLHKLVLGDKRYVTDGPRKGLRLLLPEPVQRRGRVPAGALDQRIHVGRHAEDRRPGLGAPALRVPQHAERFELDPVRQRLPPHTTGVFPIAASDPAYQYDRNPNSIKSYTLRASLARNPTS